MLDPVTTPLLILVLGKLGGELLEEACKGYLKDKLNDLFSALAGVGRQEHLGRAYEVALNDAWATCLEMLLKNIAACGYTNDELRTYADSLRAFVQDDDVANELLEAIKNPNDAGHPNPDVLAERWSEVGGAELPGDLWTPVTLAFKRQAKKKAFVNEPMREVLNAQNLDQVRKLLERQGGVRPDVHLDKYATRMRTKYASVDLANLMPAYADDPNEYVRSAALQALAQTWPDDDTRLLLRQRAVDDPNDNTRGNAATLLVQAHSEFGLRVFTRDLDGIGPYLDPHDPLPREHIEQCAARVGLPVAATGGHAGRVVGTVGLGCDRRRPAETPAERWLETDASPPKVAPALQRRASGRRVSARPPAARSGL